MQINFQALGCRLNEAELETWAAQFMQHGHQVTSDVGDADLVVFNSCAVTSEADRKSRQQINRIHRKNPAAKLVVTGCHASLNEDSVRSHLGVDLVVSNQHKEKLVEQAMQSFEMPVSTEVLDLETTLFRRGRHRGFVKVQDGCRYRCTYCIVTLARGEERSRQRQEILNEIRRLGEQGVQEAVLTGVHVGGYGSDSGDNLHDLIKAILDETDLPRLRLASVEPWDLPRGFFKLFDNQRLMPHMHLPIQSGSDSVLRRMARRCKTAEFRDLVDEARSANPLFNVTTDLIVGFPGETEQEWRQTVDFVESIGFGHMHIFSFSPRAGTKAAGLADQIDSSTKKLRSREMHALAAGLKQQALAQMVGQQVDVLWEREVDRGNHSWIGYTPHYHRIQASDADLQPSSITAIKIGSVSKEGEYLLGASRLSAEPLVSL